jgi:hypothetical protein
MRQYPELHRRLYRHGKFPLLFSFLLSRRRCRQQLAGRLEIPAGGALNARSRSQESKEKFQAIAYRLGQSEWIIAATMAACYIGVGSRGSVLMDRCRGTVPKGTLWLQYPC